MFVIQIPTVSRWNQLCDWWYRTMINCDWPFQLLSLELIDNCTWGLLTFLVWIFPKSLFELKQEKICSQNFLQFSFHQTRRSRVRRLKLKGRIKNQTSEYLYHMAKKHKSENNLGTIWTVMMVATVYIYSVVEELYS